MTIQNRSLDTVAAETSTEAAQRLDSQGSQASVTAAAGHSTDHASLSGAAGLVSLAKTLANPTYQSKVDRLASQFRSGTYQGDVAKAGRGFVNDLLGSGGGTTHL